MRNVFGVADVRTGDGCRSRIADESSASETTLNIPGHLQ